MRNLKVTIEYDGTHFNGWQIQKGNHRTIQGEIEKACQIIFKEKIRVLGSGRTDSGVHALGQVANFKIKSHRDSEEILRALNANLPQDISILQLEEVPLTFHAQYSTKSKVYRYTILNRPIRCAQQRDFSLQYPHHLNLNNMRKEAQSLIGRKDFQSFQSADPAHPSKRKEKNTIRTIKRIDIRKRGEWIYMDIEANGFLYKMVRNIVGTLIEIGSRKLPLGRIQTILKAKNRSVAGKTADAQGLCLLEVKY